MISVTVGSSIRFCSGPWPSTSSSTSRASRWRCSADSGTCSSSTTLLSSVRTSACSCASLRVASLSREPTRSRRVVAARSFSRVRASVGACAGLVGAVAELTASPRRRAVDEPDDASARAASSRSVRFTKRPPARVASEQRPVAAPSGWPPAWTPWCSGRLGGSGQRDGSAHPEPGDDLPQLLAHRVTTAGLQQRNPEVDRDRYQLRPGQQDVGAPPDRCHGVGEREPGLGVGEVEHDLAGRLEQVQLDQGVELLAQSPETRHIHAGQQNLVGGLLDRRQGVLRQTRRGIHHHVREFFDQRREQPGHILGPDLVDRRGRLRSRQHVEPTDVPGQAGLEHHAVEAVGAAQRIDDGVLGVEVEGGGDVPELQIEVDQHGGAGCGLRQAHGEIGRHRGLADATLRGQHGQYAAGDRFRAAVDG